MLTAPHPMPPPFPHAGEFAALGTAMCITVSAMSFEAAGKRVGSVAVNILRLVLAFLILAIVTSVTRGLPLPTDATQHAWIWLTLSGFVGFALGDMLLFESFVLVGSRITVLILSLAPPITGLISWGVMGERLSNRDMLGMALTVSGVAWVVLERRPQASGQTPRLPFLGILLATVGTAAEAAGLVLSKYGIRQYDAFAANQLRMIGGLAGLAVLYTIVGWWPRTLRGLRDRPALARIGLGSFFGPFLGVSLSLLALKHTQAGVAATLIALVPVFIIVPAVLIRKERVSVRAIVGAVVAVAGSALFFL